ncbi:MAG TPA: preprotein translocase subunit SecE [Bacteroidota bacterium]|nr:preprotein translocase subunit SecE [Bacteroidota bacterium]
MKEKIIAFFTDVVKEMKKVTWPTYAELRDSTIIVIVVCAVFTIFIYVLDTAVSKVIQEIF